MNPIFGPIYCVALLLLAVAANGDDVRTENDQLTLFTEDLPPYNYSEAGETKGLSVDLLLAMMQRAGIETKRSDIILVPWARAYTESLTRKNTILFTTTRTKARERLFKWVGPIGTQRQIFVAKRNPRLPKITDANLRRYRFSAVRDSSAEQRLMALDIDAAKVFHVNTQLLAMRMLVRGRVDICVQDSLVAMWALGKLGQDLTDYETVRAFEPSQVHFALNKDTNDALVAQLQAAFDALQRDGTHAAIIERYIPGATSNVLLKGEAAN